MWKAARRLGGRSPCAKKRRALAPRQANPSVKEREASRTALGPEGGCDALVISEPQPGQTVEIQGRAMAVDERIDEGDYENARTEEANAVSTLCKKGTSKNTPTS
jgi:hypothetical protein